MALTFIKPAARFSAIMRCNRAEGGARGYMVENAAFFEQMDAVDLAAHAAVLHRNAARHYSDLARLHACHADNSVPQAFHILAREEFTFADETVGSNYSTSGRSETHPLFRDDDMMIRNAATIDAYAVLAMATRNAERMFDYWSYASAHARDSVAQDAAENLARRELQLASQRRIRRRAAFRAGLRQRMKAGSRAAFEIETALAAALPATMHHAADLSRRIAEALQARDVLRAVAMPDPVQRDHAALSEFLADLYVEAAGTSASSDETQFWRGITDLALQRLAIMRKPLIQPAS